VPNVRNTSLKKYNISAHRFQELYHFCMQYNEWVVALAVESDTLHSPGITGMPMTHSNSDATSKLALKRAEYQKKKELVEECAQLADKELAKYIILSVTNENYTYPYLEKHTDIPCSRNTFYDRRKKFFWILSNKI